MHPLLVLVAVAGGGFLFSTIKKKKPSTPKPPVGWPKEWGTPSQWDSAYPDADPAKPLPVKKEDIAPELWAAWIRVEAELRRLGYNPVIFEAGRTQRRQAWLYGQGRPSFPGGREGEIVTWTLQSNHPEKPARALDIIDQKTKWSDPDFFSNLGTVAKAVGLGWGGDWTVRDLPHVELK